MKCKFRTLLLTIYLVAVSTFTSFAATRWSGVVPLPDAQYRYAMPAKRGGISEHTIYAKPGEKIQTSWHYGKRSTMPQILNYGGIERFDTTKKTNTKTGSFTTYYTWTIPQGYTGGTIDVYLPPWDNVNNEGDRIYYGDAHIIVHINPAPCEHSSNTWRYDVNNLLGILPFAERFSHSYECST